MACASCGPAELETTETAVEDPYPFATWETCSQAIGDHPCNFTLPDQNGEEVSLYDFYGAPIVLDLSVMWCGPCQLAGSDVQATTDRFSDDGLRYITMLIEDLGGEPVDVVDAESWATTLGIISEPVLQGSRDMLSPNVTTGWPLASWPTFVLITADMKIYTFQAGYSQTLLDSLIEETIAQTQP